MNRHIDCEIILKRKVAPLMYVYVMIILVIILFLITIFTLYHYKMYYDIRGTIVEEENHYYIKMYVPIDKLKYITKNQIILLDKKEYQYSVVSIDSEYITDNLNTYQMVKIESNLPNKYLINNLTLDIKLLKEDKLVIDYILNK